MTPPTPKDVIAWKVEQSGDWTVVFDADKAAQYEVDSTVTPLSPAEMATVYNEMARELTEHREKCAAYYGDAVGWELQASTLRAERDAAVRERDALIVRGKAGDDYLAYTAAERNQLRTRLAAVERDAKRYQWVREEQSAVAEIMMRPKAGGFRMLCGEALDAAIDAALTPTRQTAGGEDA